MKGDPILREKFTQAKSGGRYYRRAFGGLHYIRGNSAPYFSLTYEEGAEGARDCDMCGACHEEILEHWPDLADLAALHLSDVDGAPMHAAGNGWYWLAGTFPDAFGERYHGGNSTPARSADECLAIFAKHVRVSLDEARTIRDQVHAAAMAARHSRNAVASAKLAEIVEAMRPRWKAEAAAVIKKHGLQFYGDTWEPTNE
jgi:hypothetical protein